MRKKIIILIPVIFYLLFFLINNQHSNIEEKIIDDINIGGANNSDFIIELLLVDEPYDDFYICLGETTYNNICIFAIEYNASGVEHAVKRTISKNQILSNSMDSFKIDNKNIKFTFTEKFDEKDFQTNIDKIKQIPFTYYVNKKEKNAVFVYFFE